MIRSRCCRWSPLPLAVALLAMLTGCQPQPQPKTASDPAAVWYPGADTVLLNEAPVPDGRWRGHTLSRCAEVEFVPAKVRSCLATGFDFYQEGSGSDGMIEMELYLESGVDHPLVLLALGQLYLMAGQGEPTLLPVEGPAADTGNWRRNKKRLLQRARSLLEGAGAQRTDDAAVDYLLADVARAGDELTAAEEFEARGHDKCTSGWSFDILRQYQQLNRYPARLQAVPSPEYPESAVRRRLSGPVVLDLLLDPAGRVRQSVAVATPGPVLTAAAVEAFESGDYDPARIGKYPVWAWLRVTTSFDLAD